MPELPEVETVRRGLEKAVHGERILNVTLRRENLRIPFPEGFSEKLCGRKIQAVRRRAKYLLFDLEGGISLIGHLGMSGNFRFCDAAALLRPHDHVVFMLERGNALVFNDPRRFGLMDIAPTQELEAHLLFAHLGPEPLSDDFSVAYLKKALARRSGPIKNALMDAALVVGVGNIYACEALFGAKISPDRPAGSVSGKAEIVHESIRKVLEEAIQSGGSSLRDFLSAEGKAGYFQHRFQVYGREGKPCFHCAAPIQRIRQAGRSTFFCTACQK